MKTYNPESSLISFHVPRCAGTSLRYQFLKWFGKNLKLHYYHEQEEKMPEQHSLGTGVCLHGHFQHIRGFGVEDFYPDARQFVTILRHPLHQAVSNYNYLRKSLSTRSAEFSKIDYDVKQEYQSLDNYLQQAHFPLTEYLPFGGIMTKDNYKDILEEYFVYIGITEDMQQSLYNLAGVLGFPRSSVCEEKLNAAPRTEDFSADTVSIFEEKRELDFLIYNYAAETYGHANVRSRFIEEDYGRYVSGVEGALEVVLEEQQRVYRNKDNYIKELHGRLEEAMAWPYGLLRIPRKIRKFFS